MTYILDSWKFQTCPSPFWASVWQNAPSVNFLRPAPSHPQCSVPVLCHVAWADRFLYLLSPGIICYRHTWALPLLFTGLFSRLWAWWFRALFTPFCAPLLISPLREAHSLFLSQEPSCIAWCWFLFLPVISPFSFILHFNGILTRVQLLKWTCGKW